MTSTRPLANVRVLEVATHVFVPMAGAVLTEWGADVVKIEHPETGDPYRSLVTAGTAQRVPRATTRSSSPPTGASGRWASTSSTPTGARCSRGSLQRTDVFMTSLRADARRRLRLDVDAIRADNPSCVYVRGTAFGVRGPDAGRGGYDTGSYWARSGMQHVFTHPDAAWPTGTRPAFGDVVGGLTIAGAVSAALYQRATTGVAPIDRRVPPRVRDVADPTRHRQRQARRRGHPSRAPNRTRRGTR